MKVKVGNKILNEQPVDEVKKKSSKNSFGAKALKEIEVLVSMTEKMIFLSESEAEASVYKNIRYRLNSMKEELISLQKEITKEINSIFNKSGV